MDFGGDAGPDPVTRASKSSSFKVSHRGMGERMRARAKGAEGLSCRFDVLDVAVEGFVEHSVEDVEKYGDVLSAESLEGEVGLSEDVGLEDDTRVDEVKAAVELSCEAPGTELALGAAVDAGLDLTAVDGALECSGGLV